MSWFLTCDKKPAGCRCCKIRLTLSLRDAPLHLSTSEGNPSGSEPGPWRPTPTPSCMFCGSSTVYLEYRLYLCQSSPVSEAFLIMLLGTHWWLRSWCLCCLLLASSHSGGFILHKCSRSVLSVKQTQIWRDGSGLIHKDLFAGFSWVQKLRPSWLFAKLTDMATTYLLERPKLERHKLLRKLNVTKPSVW